MKEGLLGGTLGVSPRSESEEARLHVARWTGSESPQGRRLPAVARRARSSTSGRRRPTPTGCAAWPRAPAMWGPAVRGVIESMNGARFVHDRLEEHGWDVLIADATKVKGLAPLACKTDKIDARVLATLSARDLVPEIWLPDPTHPPRARAGALPAAPGPPSHDAEEPHPRRADRLRPAVPGLRSVRPRRPRAARPPRRSPTRGAATSTSALALIDDLELQIAALTVQLKRQGADHRYIPLLVTAPGIGWINALHHRLGDRRHRPLRLAGQAVRLHRPVPARQAVRRQSTPAARSPSTAPSTCAGRCSRPP